MATVILQEHPLGAPFNGSQHQANLQDIEDTFTDLGPYVISGITLSNGGGLSIGVSTGVTVVGGHLAVTVGFSIVALADNTTNHLYLLNTGAGASNTTGVQPTSSVKLGTAVTAGGLISSIDATRASGRQQKPDLTTPIPLYTVANSVPDRSYDAAATTTAELAQVVAAVIADLKTMKLLG